MSEPTWPPVARGPVWKPSRAARHAETRTTRLARQVTERTHKQAARRRDGYRCRFPQCGCRALRLGVEVAHHRHKGMGGDPTCARSTPVGLVTLCRHRHQDGAISLHRGTLRARFLTPAGYDGCIAWEVDVARLRADHGARAADWVEVAREASVPGVWEPAAAWQQAVLAQLAGMQW